MKHVEYFDDFLKRNVNLNQYRLDTLDKKVETITELLKSNLDGYRGFSLQGSYAHKTIIRPVAENDEFDADILVFIKDENFKPNQFQEDYVKKTYDVFKNNGNYERIVRPNTRCVTIDYSGDFHLDIVPCIEHQKDFYICNRTEKKYEQTDGDGYKKWFADRNKVTGKNHLRKVTRLLKFLRDHKSNYSIESIVLTTLLGNCVYDSDKNSSEFSDVPQALKTLSNRVNDFLKSHQEMPTIENPVLSWEDFNRNWDKTKYRNFREKFDLYNTRIDKAFEEKDHNKSVELWQELFGDNFGELRKSTSGSRTNVAAGFSPTVYAQRPYFSHKKNVSPMNTNEYSAAEMKKIQRCFPNLRYDTGAVKGKIDFSSVRYELSSRKKKEEWKIAPCSSGDDCIQDAYEIVIHLNGQIKVFEVGGRIPRIAKQHVSPEDGSCCLGLFSPNTKETLSEFVINKVYPFFVWQAYYEKFGKIPPCGEYSHGKQGVDEFQRHFLNTGRNDRCPCASGKKAKNCCHYRTRSTSIRFRQ